MADPRHEEEVDRNREIWDCKPLLRHAYATLTRRVDALIDRHLHGISIEIGSGIASLRQSAPDVLMTDSFARPWLDLTLNAYELPLRDATVANAVAVDVLHHLAQPRVMLDEIRRVLVPGGRLILVEPYISMLGWLIYGALHDEPVAWHQPIDWSSEKPDSAYYAAQGNATRLFFRGQDGRWSGDWKLIHGERFAALEYILSGGFSRPAVYPRAAAPFLARLDPILSRWPSVFATRCVVVLMRR